MTKRLAPSLALCSSLASLRALAADAPPPPPPDLTGKAELSFVSTSGNTDTQTLGAGLELVYKKPTPWTFTLKSAFVRSESDGTEKARSFASSLRASRAVSPRLDFYAQGDYLTNTYAGIDARLGADLGAEYKLLTGPKHTLKGSASIGYVKEDRVTGEDLSFAAGKAGLGYKWAFSKTADFTNDAVFTYDFADSQDWRFADVAALNASLTSVFSLKVSWALAYVNKPAATFGKTDTVTTAALVAKF